MNDAALTLVLMAGLSGSGKSTLARKLSRKLKWHYIEKDMFREVLIQQGLDEEKVGEVAYEIALACARQELTMSQASVILDSSALYKITLRNALHIAHSIANVQLKVILCVADRDLRKWRMRNRRPSQDSANVVDPVTIAEYLLCYQHLPEDKLTLFTNGSLEDCLATASDYLMGGLSTGTLWNQEIGRDFWRLS